jgi:FG-GAP-like repeat/RTX calcium-binding nonapeptide repeat (4 copies)
LSAYLKVGIEPFSYTKTFDSPRVTLLNFNEDCQPELTTSIKLAQSDNGNLRLNIGLNAPARLVLSVLDEAEVFSVKHVSGAAGSEVVVVTASLNKTIDNTNFITTQNFGAGSKIIGNGGEKDDVLEVKSDSPVLTPVAFSGGAGQDLLVGGSGDDLLNGDAGLDRLYGGLGNDSLFGGVGDDWLIGEGGVDILDGGDGFDIASYSTSKSGVVVNLATGVNGGDAVGDTFKSIEQITGSAYADVITGDAANNIIEGAAGNDTISGGDGDDILLPNWGDDVVDGGNGTDTLVIDYSTLPTQAVAWVANNDVQGHYYAYVRNAYGIGDAINTGLDAFGSYHVDISGDGTTLAVSGGQPGGIRVRKIHDNSDSIQIANAGADPVLSGKGDKVVWDTSNSINNAEIWVANTDGSQVKQLTNDNISDKLVTISADGSTIAWAKAITPNLYADGLESGTYRTEIFVSNVDGSNVRRITNNNWDDPRRSLSLSADGSKVTWQVDGFYGPTSTLNDASASGFWIANTDGTGLRQLYNTRFSNQNPSISGDGSKVTWVDTGAHGERSESFVYITNTDNPNVKIVPNTVGAWAFSPHSLSGDGKRVVFSRNTLNGSPEGLYVASVDGTEPLTLIDNSSPGWSYGGNVGQGAAISDYVDKGVIYKSFDSTTGSGEIFTWGPSRVRYSNIERFDIIGTRYGDELKGGNLDDRLVGGGGADILRGFLGNDTYGFNIANSAGSQIEDTGGNDVLELKNTTTDGSGIQKDQNVEISLSSPNNGIIGVKRDGSNLIIDINKDGITTAKTDLSIINFFNTTGTAAGNGFIETIQNLSGNDILNKFKTIAAETTVRSDFNGDKKSDILWRSDVGGVSVWQMNGAIVTSTDLTSTPNLDPTWATAGTGDFNGDGKSDILWRNSKTGAVDIWTMNGATVTASTLASTPTLATNWRTVGTGDFSGDGKADILWRNDLDDRVVLWTMDGTNVVSSVATSTPTLDQKWKAAGTGDFNGDGKADMLWRNDDGSVALWQMNATAVTSISTSTPRLDSSWKINGTADFNGDGKSDILWRNTTTGNVAVWQMNGAAVVSSTATSTPSLDSTWQVADTSDFSGDGKSDILWRNDTGATTVWQMSGSDVISSNLTSLQPLAGWQVAKPIL